jgi:hypothetical protein
MLIKSRLYPHPDEGFFSYAVRIAEENGYPNYHSVYHAAELKIRKGFNLNILFKEDLEKNGLTKTLGPIVASKINCMIQKTKSGNRIYDVEVYGKTIPNYLVVTSFVKLCSACMVDNRYIKNLWQFLPITTCHLHKCLLIDQCPICHSPFQWHSSVLEGCRSCGANWELIYKKSTTVPVHETILSDLFCHKLGLIPMPTRSNYAEGLFDLEFNELASLLSLTAWVMPGDHLFWNMNYFKQKNNADIHQLLMNSVKVYSEWPNQFFSFLSQLQGQINYYSKGKGKRSKEESPGIHLSAFGDYYTKLYDELTANSFDFVRDAFEIFMVKHKKNAYIKQYRKIDFSKLTMVYYTGQDVLKKYGMDPKTFRTYIQRGFFDGFETLSNKKKVMLATRESVDMFMLRHNESLNSFDAAARIGINHERLLIDLYKAGFIKAIRGPEVDRHQHWRFDAESLDQLRDMFESRVIVKDADPQQVINFHKASKTIEGRYTPSYLELITKVQEGSLHPCGVDNEQIGLCRFQFVKSDVNASFKHELDKIKNDQYSLVEASQKLQMSRNRLSYLIKQGFLEHRIEPNGYILISYESLKCFKDTYITLGEIQKQTGKSGLSLLILLKGENYLPVNGEKIHEAHQYLFARTDELLRFINPWSI